MLTITSEMSSTIRAMFRSVTVLVSALAVLWPRIATAEEPRRLTLEQVTAAALKNPLATAAHYDTRAAKARIREMKGLQLARFKLTTFVAPSPKIECDNEDCTSTSPDDVPINIGGIYAGAKLSLTQPLSTFGKGSAVIAATRHAAAAAQHEEDAVAGDLAYRAATAYYSLKLARELIWMLEDGRDEIVKGRKTLEEKLAEGSPDVTVQDRLRLETLEAEVETRLTDAREAEATALAGIRALVGDEAVDIDDAPLAPADYNLLSGGAESYVERAEQELPELAAARAGVDALHAMTRYERARYLPDLALVASVNVARATSVDNPPSAFARDPFNTTGGELALVLRWKLDPLSQPARVARARETAKRAEALLEAAGRMAEFEVRKAHARAEQAKKRLEAAKKGEKAARGWVASVLQADAVGAASAKDLADAYLAYFTLRGRVLQSAYDWNLAIVALRRAVGEFHASK